ncbi:hypothetical protein N7499_012054 [Penicillium canescens]|nr:hypothetical protein N7499_012054 [Penicillium canescens]KAJ6181782.1 hypothetical protein N7485_000424 [Penicillium canescens]
MQKGSLAPKRWHDTNQSTYVGRIKKSVSFLGEEIVGITVDPSNPGPVEIFAKEKAREQVPATFYNQNLRTIVPTQCFNTAVQDGTNTIFVAFSHKVARNKENIDSVSRALAGGSDQSVPDNIASL